MAMIDSKSEPYYVLLANKVLSYELAYYSELRRQLEHYRSIKDIFPKYFYGYKDLDIIIANGGIVVAHWESAIDNYKFYKICKNPFDILNKIYLDLPQYRKILLNDNKQNFSDKFFISMSENSRWSEELAISTAQNDINRIVISHLLNIKPDKSNLFIDKLESTIKHFESLLNSHRSDERAIQRYLEDNPIILSATAARITPQVKLGKEYQVDFVIEEPNDNYILVEIEPPSCKLFNRKGDPTKELTHGQRQVEDWRRWLRENISYAKNEIRELENIGDPKCWVIIGRSNDLKNSEKKSLTQKNSELMHIEIMTYDELLNNAKSHLSNLRNFN